MLLFPPSPPPPNMLIGVGGRVRAGIARRDKRREETAAAAAAAAALHEIVFLAPCRRRTPPYPSLPPTFPVVHPPPLVAYCLVGLTKAPPPANPFNFFTTCDRQPASIIPSQMRYRPQFRCRCRRRRRRRFRRQNTYSTTFFPAPFTVGHRPMSKSY